MSTRYQTKSRDYPKNSYDTRWKPVNHWNKPDYRDKPYYDKPYNQVADQNAFREILSYNEDYSPIAKIDFPKLRTALEEKCVFKVDNNLPEGTDVYIKGHIGKFNGEEFVIRTEGIPTKINKQKNSGIMSPEDVEAAALKSLTFQDPGFELVIIIRKDGNDREFYIQFKQGKWSTFFPPNVWNKHKEIYVVLKIRPKNYFTGITLLPYEEKYEEKSDSSSDEE